MIKFYFRPIRRRIRIKAKRYIPKKQKHALAFSFTCVFLILSILFILLDIPIRPVVRENAKYIVKNEVTIMINECVGDYISENDLVYSDLITVSLNDKKEITSVGTDTIAINKLKSDITNAIANGGTYMKPMLLKKVETAEGELVKEFKPQAYKALMTEQEADTLTMLMTSVVEQGTATKLKGLEYTAAGKTGSAEYNKVKEDSHAWFTGFAPAEDPEISVTIIVERIGSGGDYAVPIAKRLFDAYFAIK